MNSATVDRALLYALWIGILLNVLMPFVVTTSTIFPFIVGKVLYFRIITEITLGIWLVLAYRNPSYRLPFSWLLLILAIYLAISAIAGLFGVSFQRSLWSTYERMQGVFDLAHWFAFTLIMVSVLRNLRSWRYLLMANLIASVVIALLGIAQVNDINVIPFYEFLRASQRIDGPLGNPAFLGAYMLVNIFLALGLLAYSLQTTQNSEPQQSSPARRRRRQRAARENTDFSPLLLRGFLVFAILLNTLVLFLTGTRGAFVGLFAGLLFAAIAYSIWGNQRLFRLASASILGFLVIVVLLFAFGRTTSVYTNLADSSVMLKRLGNVSLNDPTLRGRLISLSIGLEAFQSKPITGWGPENYLVAFGRHSTETETTTETFDQAHNKPLEELATKGILGFVTYITLWVFMFWTIVNALRKLNDRRQFLNLFIGSALVGYFVQNLFLFDTPATVLQFFILLAYLAYVETQLSNASAEESSKEPGRAMPFAFLNNIQQVFQTSKRYEVLRSPWVGYGILTVALALLAVNMYFANIRLYYGASSILRISQENSSLDDILENANKSIDSFPPLANYPRMIMINNLGINWENMSQTQRQQALNFVQTHTPDAIEAEPENWRLYVTLTKFYQDVGAYESSYLETAETYMVTAAELAPERPETSNLKVNHQRIVDALN